MDALESLQKRVSSNDPDALMKAIDETIDLMGALVRVLIKRLEVGDHPLLVSERLWKCGTIACLPLRELVDSTKNEEVKLEAALVLLWLKDQHGVAHLVDNVNAQYVHFRGVTRLMQAGIDVTDKIIQRLRSCAVTDKDTISGLLGILEDFKRPLPADLISRFSQL